MGQMNGLLIQVFVVTVSGKKIVVKLILKIKINKIFLRINIIFLLFVNADTFSII